MRIFDLMFEFDQYLGFLLFMTVVTMGFWLMILLLTFIIPYWVTGSFFEWLSERKNKNSNKPLSSKTSINKLVFDEGRKHQIYFRTLGNIIMLVPPLAISQKDLNFLIDGTISTIKSISRKLR